ncbi:MAG TPA: POTRA domain-containing protein [Gammaproteobacteria bacterium]|jgi:hemolysin activation/secretion protein|nr:POTRA domain-containing protein [Gammaproteobacteria bacterium]
MRRTTLIPALVLAVLGWIGPDRAHAQPAAPASSAEPARAPDDTLTSVGSIRLTDVAVQGNTVFSEQELAELAAPLENQDVSFERLQELRHELSRRYVERGYVTSGVVIPDQRVTDGVVVLRAVEGELTQIDVEGNHRLRSRPIERRVEHYVTTPVNVADLQTSLSSLQKDPLVERVNAELVPGERLGESRLNVAVTERAPLELSVTAANDRSASIGENRASVGLTYRGLVGNGDSLSGRFGISEGAGDNALFYNVPLTPGGVKLDIVASEQAADIVEEPFKAIDISSRIDLWSIGASRSFVDDGRRALSAQVVFEHKRSESTLLAAPFSFSPGDVDGKAVGSSVVLGTEWSRNFGTRSLVVRGSLQFGVDVLNPTHNDVGPDGDFALFFGQLQLVQNLRWRASRILVRGVLQVADDSLLAMYKLPIGGRYSVRGYRESQLVRDNGFAASAEWQFPALVDSTGQARGHLDVATFVDYGSSVDAVASGFGPRREHIASVGVGLLWHPLPGLSMELYRGVPLVDLHNTGDSLQDRGLHYALVYRRAIQP